MPCTTCAAAAMAGPRHRRPRPAGRAEPLRQCQAAALRPPPRAASKCRFRQSYGAPAPGVGISIPGAARSGLTAPLRPQPSRAELEFSPGPPPASALEASQAHRADSASAAGRARPGLPQNRYPARAGTRLSVLARTLDPVATRCSVNSSGGPDRPGRPRRQPAAPPNPCVSKST